MKGSSLQALVRFLAVGEADHLVAGLDERPLDEGAHGFVVLCQQNASCWQT